MTKVVLFVLFLCVVSFIQVRKLMSNKQKAETFAYLTVMLIVGVAGTMMIGNVRPPDPTVPLKLICESLGRQLMNP